MIGATIVAIAKLEHYYIEEWVKYHLSLGFFKIVLYDNEDVPTYRRILKRYESRVLVIHYPGRGRQYQALNHFVTDLIRYPFITHILHIDIDEFVVLKKHKHINDFIQEYITGNCVGIAINWRYFGSSNKTEQTNEPVTIRFTQCQIGMDPHVKTLFDKRAMRGGYSNIHYINTIPGTFIKSTNGSIVKGPHNDNYDSSVIQINHYKSKTLGEFRRARTRGKADFNSCLKEDVDANFKLFDRNEETDLTASEFYKTVQHL